MRYSAQRYGTWEWLDLELPITTDGPEWALNTYGVMYGTLAPELGYGKAADGRPVLEEWGTLIHAETGEGALSRRWTGIVVRSELQGKNWEVTVREFPGYMDGTPIETNIWGVKADPAALFRQVWTDAQAIPNANLNVSVIGSTTLRVGTDSDDKAAAAKIPRDADKKDLDAKNKVKKKATDAQQAVSKAQTAEIAPLRKANTADQETVNNLVKNNGSKTEIQRLRDRIKSRQDTIKSIEARYKPSLDAKKAAKEAADKAYETANEKYQKSNEVYEKAKEKAREDGGAYKFLAEDTPDAAQSLDTMCKDHDLEWYTETRYTNGAPDLRVHVAHPSVGSKRDDLVFEQGVNIISELRLVRNGEEYANASLGIGAGEGDKSIRASIASTSKRLRRVNVYDDRKLKTKAQLLAAMRDDLKRRTGNLYVPEITVVDDPMAPMFSWNVGDYITVSGHVPHVGYYTRLHRIISWQMVGDTKATLHLELATNV